MNEVANSFLLAGDKFMPKMDLGQPGFTYSAWGSFTRNKGKIKKIKETRDSRYIHQNELDKACFQHDMAYGDFTYLPRRTASDKTLCDKAFNIAENSKYDGYQRRLVSMVYKSFDKKTSGGAVKNKNMPNQELAEELHKPIIINFEKRKVNLPFIDNISGDDLADTQLISKFNKRIRFFYMRYWYFQ